MGKTSVDEKDVLPALLSFQVVKYKNVDFIFGRPEL